MPAYETAYCLLTSLAVLANGEPVDRYIEHPLFSEHPVTVQIPLEEAEGISELFVSDHENYVEMAHWKQNSARVGYSMWGGETVTDEIYIYDEEQLRMAFAFREKWTIYSVNAKFWCGPLNE